MRDSQMIESYILTDLFRKYRVRIRGISAIDLELLQCSISFWYDC